MLVSLSYIISQLTSLHSQTLVKAANKALRDILHMITFSLWLCPDYIIQIQLCVSQIIYFIIYFKLKRSEMAFLFWKSKFRAFAVLSMIQHCSQGIDGSARKPALIQDTGYIVEKTYHEIAPYLGAFGAYLMPQ